MKLSIATTACAITLLISACVQEQNPIAIEKFENTVGQALPPNVSIFAESTEPGELQVLAEAEMDTVDEVAASSQVQDTEINRLMMQTAEKKQRVRKDMLYPPKEIRPSPLFSAASIQQGLNPLPINRDNYARIIANSVKLVSEYPVSTFSIDVDTGSYTVVRRHLNNGVLPPGNAVRVEELVNYFDYQYPSPKDSDAPFSISTEMATTPWNKNTRLLQVGLQGYLPDDESRSAANLVFLIDVSGSMNSPDKLPLLKNAFRLLVKKLDQQDQITMVVYAGSSGVVLETTGGDKKGDILAALDKLQAGGSTHGSSGIRLAYDMAEQSFIKGGINRVILATDGDFNVGTVNHEALLDLIEQKKSLGIALTTLGFGSGNYNDHLMEQLADHGDGNYAYIDNLNEARKVLVEQVSATLETIARDVKIQIEWNPAIVSEYRLIGYENRLLKREDFNNDKVDAGDIGAGHNVTALYEVTLSDSAQSQIDPLRYQHEEHRAVSNNSELAFIKLRYKKPADSQSRLIQQVLLKQQIKASVKSASNSLRFAAAVAAYGELLRGGEKVNDYSYEQVLKLARGARGQDQHGYRAEFIRLVEMSDLLDSRG